MDEKQKRLLNFLIDRTITYLTVLNWKPSTTIYHLLFKICKRCKQTIKIQKKISAHKGFERKWSESVLNCGIISERIEKCLTPWRFSFSVVLVPCLYFWLEFMLTFRNEYVPSLKGYKLLIFGFIVNAFKSYRPETLQ